MLALPSAVLHALALNSPTPGPPAPEGFMYPENLTRPWRTIAAEVAQEFDSNKFNALIEELNRALEQVIGDQTARARKQIRNTNEPPRKAGFG